MKKVFALFGTIALDGMSTVNKQLTGLDKTLKDASKALMKTGRDLDKLGLAMTKTFTAPIAAAGTAVTMLATKTGQYADHLLDLEQITGLSTDSLQEFEHVGRVAGVSFDGLVGIITKFTNQLPEIEKGGNTASVAFKKLGVPLRDSAGNIRSMNDLFPDMIAALQNVENVTERNALAQDIFGRSLTDLAPVLGMTAEQLAQVRQEAHTSGLVMSKDALNAANDFRVEMEKLKGEIAVAGRGIAVDFIPILRDTVLPLIRSRIVPAIRNFIDNVKSLAEWFRSLPPGMREAIIKFSALLAVIGPLTIGLGKTMKAVAGLRGTVLLLNKALLANPYAQVALAITALVGILGGLYLQHINNTRVQKEFNSAMESGRDISRELSEEYGKYLDREKARVDNMEKGMKVTNDLTLFRLRFNEELAAKMKEDPTTNISEFKKKFKEKWGLFDRDTKNSQEQLQITGEIAKENWKTEEALKNKKKEASDEELEAHIENLEKKIAAEEAWVAEMESNFAKIDEMKKEDYRQRLVAWDAQQEKNNQVAKNQLDMEAAVRAQQKASREDIAETDRKNSEEQIRRSQAEYEVKVQIAGSFFNTLSMFNNNAEIAADNKYKKDRERIENSLMSEEDKAAALEKLDGEYEKKRNEMRRRQAIIDKAQAIFDIGINTAVAIVKALPNMVLSGIIGALGAAQAAAVVAQPIPAAEKGAYLPGSDEGTVIRAGEKRKPEIILPLDTGIDALVSRMTERTRGFFPQSAPPAYSSPAYQQMAAAGAVSGGGGGLTINIGTYVGNRAGLKDLYRKLDEVGILEATRIGAIG